MLPAVGVGGIRDIGVEGGWPRPSPSPRGVEAFINRSICKLSGVGWSTMVKTRGLVALSFCSSGAGMTGAFSFSATSLLFELPSPFDKPSLGKGTFGDGVRHWL